MGTTGTYGPFFPYVVIVTHFLNIFFMLLLARSGLEVLAAFPKLYWNDHCPPGREWLRFSRRTFAADSRHPWSSLDEEVSWSPVISLPGRKNLGLGRHWHFMSVQFWVLTGAVYIAWVFASGYWHYLVPTSWSIFPDAVRAVGDYLQFRYPPLIPGQPFNAIQKLSYFAVVFLLAPFQIATGAAMSPAVLARFPWYAKPFGGKQGARSLHFLGLCAFALFTVVHTAMVIIHGVPHEFAAMVFGSYTASGQLGLAIGLTGIFLILVFHVVISWFSLHHRPATQRLLGAVVNPFEQVISRAFTSRQRFTRADISPYHRVNGYPRTDPEYDRMAADDFREYRLPIGGLVENPMLVSLADLRGFGRQSQITKHNCIQGWTSIAEWTGVPLSDVVQRVRPGLRAKTRHTSDRPTVGGTSTAVSREVVYVRTESHRGVGRAAIRREVDWARPWAGSAPEQAAREDHHAGVVEQVLRGGVTLAILAAVARRLVRRPDRR